jgi:hypothetical protein
MGYTRYYRVEGKIDPIKFKDYSKDCKMVCEEITKQSGHGLAGWNGEGEPRFEDEGILFNGVGDLSHETFGLGPETSGFNFTKTQRKPYDKHVLACLILAKEYFGDNIKVSSDGDNNDKEIEELLISLRRDNKIKSILDGRAV